MSDKSKQRAKDFARQHGISHQAAVNRLRKIVNAPEREVESRLDGVAAENGARVYAKLRLADAIAIESSGISDRAYSFALKAHLDFVVTDEVRRPLFAVEFDGPGHDAANDALKNQLCEDFGLPLARLRQRHLSLAAGADRDAVAWLARVEFTYRQLVQAQEDGIIPWDEPLDPLSIMSNGRHQGSFPLSPAIRAAHRFRELANAGRLRGFIPFRIAVGTEEGGTALVAQEVSDGMYVTWQESIYLRGFGVTDSEAANELAMVRLVERVDAHIGGDNNAITKDAVLEEMNAVLARGEFHGGGGGRDFALTYRTENGRMVTRAASGSGGGWPMRGTA